jgi:hypothetical protein
MTNLAPLVYNYAFDKVVKITANPAAFPGGSSGEYSTGTGFIMGIEDKRIIVIACAHEVLVANGVTYPTYNNSPFTCTVTGAIKSGSKEKQNIVVNLFILGTSTSDDVVVLCSYKKDEINSSRGILYGFNFSSKNSHFTWGDSKNTPVGSQVFSLTNAYAEGISESTGIIHDNNFILAASDASYLNFTDQVLTSMDVDLGSSGAPILVINSNGNNEIYALVIGMVAWLRVTSSGNFIGGPAQQQMQKSYEKILKLNNIKNINVSPNYIPINFDGNTGKGFLGIAAYQALDQTTAFNLCQQYPAYTKSKYANRIGGFVITQITDINNPPIKIHNSRINNAKNLKTGLRTGLQVNDIIIEVNGVTVSLNDNPEYVTYDSYNNRDTPIFMTIIRPCIGQIMEFEIISDKYPDEYNIVSTSNLIELVDDSSYNFTNVSIKFQGVDSATLQLYYTNTSYIFTYNGVNNNTAYDTSTLTLIFDDIPTSTKQPLIKWIVQNNTIRAENVPSAVAGKGYIFSIPFNPT